MKTTIGVLIFTLSCLLSFAHTMGLAKFKCPIDGTEFEALQDASGTSFGAQLDLKKTGPIPQPWKLAQCPKCRLPLYEEKFDATKLARLSAIVQSERFIRETKDASPYYALGIVLEELKEPPFQIGWVYLNASWEVEDNQIKYKETCLRAIAGFDKAAVSFEKNKDKRDEYLLSKYLPIELARRVGNFKDASARLDAFAKTDTTEIDWLERVLVLQAALIKAKDSSIREIPPKQKK